MESAMESAMMAVLSIRNLRVSFGDEVVLPGLNLEIAPGEFCCLLGPSGCGKTTLLKTIAGFVQPSGGAIFLGGREITHRPPQKRDVGMVFQNFALFPHLSVFDNIAYGLKRRRMDREEIEQRVDAMLKTIGLTALAERRIGALSGGQQQRVALARILVLSPRLLLFDEPLSNLDARLRISLRDEIREIQAGTGVPALFVTHDQEEAMQMGHRIALMEAGRLVQEGSPREIYEQPATLFVADFIGATNCVPARIEDQRLYLLGQAMPLPPGPLPSGRRLQAVIRPEQIQLADLGAGGLNGVIQARRFMGAYQLYQVALHSNGEPDRLLTVKSYAAAVPYHEGDRVSITIAPTSIQLFGND
jgi:ABC-type Fe3+/spermidine/putrescine transport system ATPase subunit